jgi:hypothetical protein
MVALSIMDRSSAEGSHELKNRKRGLAQVAALFILFSASFLLPIGFGYLAYQKYFHGGSAFSAALSPVPQAFVVNDDEASVVIAHADDLNPLPAKDFLLTAWFYPKPYPREGQRITLLSKFSPELPGKPGYAIALSHELDGFRIHVYWKESSRKGRWYSFSESPLVPGNWFMVALSLQKGRYLGVHTVTRVGAEQVETTLAGGFDLGGETRPDSPADMTLGAVRGGKYRGAIGPLAIVQGTDVAGELKQTLKGFSRDPIDIPGNVSSKEVRFFSKDLMTDESNFEHAVKRNGGKASASK